MAEARYSAEDLALLADLDRAARSNGVEACLIGAGAIQLGPDGRWSMRLARRTKDWDFAVRVDSWSQYGDLVATLVSEKGGFSRAPEPHRFRHVHGGTLDVVPYGGLETSRGRIKWPDGTEMSTAGMSVLDRHYEVLHVEALALRTASRPAVIGLKLLTYLDRRSRRVLRDIQDVYTLLRGADDVVPESRVRAEALEQLTSGTITYELAGAYLLGRDVAEVFRQGELDTVMAELGTLREPRIAWLAIFSSSTIRSEEPASA